MYKINLQISEEFRQHVDSELLLHTARVTLKETEVHTKVELTIVISGDSEIQSLNEQFRGIGAPTDVLSFPAEVIDPDSGNRYLGDIVISYPIAEHQACQRGHTVVAELKLLLVHGILHLLGYDHLTPEDRAHMWRAQAEILSQIDNASS